MTSLFEIHLLGGSAIFLCLISVCLFVILPLAVLGRGCKRIGLGELTLSVALAVSPAMAQKPKAAVSSDACNPQLTTVQPAARVFIPSSSMRSQQQGDD